MNGPNAHLPVEDEADLAALADGALYGPRRAAVQDRLAREPSLAVAFERQREAASMLSASAPRAPLRLRLLVDELEGAQPVLRRRRRRWASAAAAVAATFVVLPAGRGPAVADVLAVALRPATAPASLDRSFEGVRFPSYDRWRPTGERADVVDGRDVRTVFYEHDGLAIAYAIVSGPALSEDEALREIRGAGVVAVTWTRDGRTCAIAAAGVSAEVLARLAVWQRRRTAAG